jgi:putative oxidoreductase
MTLPAIITGPAQLLARLQIPAQALWLLGLRIYMAQFFFSSGLVKLKDWDSTVALFADEYKVPVLPPAIAAFAGTAGEIGLPILLAFGIAGRFGAMGLLVMNSVILLTYEGLVETTRMIHVYWGLLLATLVIFGSGKLSVDGLLLGRFWNRVFGR